jgi:tRNA (Thr-GGU) A37 N-methylase
MLVMLVLLLLLLLLLAQVIDVDAAAGVLVLGGVDIVDGSPVLDVKPYVPFSDALPGATAPNWVTVSCSFLRYLLGYSAAAANNSEP